MQAWSLAPDGQSSNHQAMSRRKFPPKLEVTVDEIDAEGVGLARWGERDVRVKAGLPGEEVVARTVGRRKGAALAVTEQLTANVSADRQDVPCAFFPRCGGCALQHLNYDSQLRLKQQGLLDELEHCEVSFEKLRAPVGSPQFGYRRKARLGVRALDELLLVGFREAFGGRIVKMTQCMALTPPFDELFPALAALINELSIPGAVPQIETAVGDAQAALVIRHLEALDAKDARLLGEFQLRHNVTIYTQADGYDSVTPLRADAAMPNYSLPEFGVNLEFAVTDFIQVNRVINNALVRAVAAAFESGDNQNSKLHIADMFCGIGNFSLPLARRGHQVSGWEAASEAIERARSNAHRNGLSECTAFAVADLYGLPGDKKLKTEVAQLGGVDALVLDPPRSGAGPALASWLGERVRKVVYVSCNPKTFASDAVVLGQHNFVLTDVGIYDMFPHTAHVETLGIFERRG